MTAHFYLPWRDQDELILIPAGDSHRIRLELRSEQRFNVVVGDQFPVSVESFKAALDPNEKAYPKPEAEIRKQGRRPTVFVWYTAPKPAGPVMAEPSEEEKELLSALGYLGSTQP